jgi:TPR repeat protein
MMEGFCMQIRLGRTVVTCSAARFPGRLVAACLMLFGCASNPVWADDTYEAYEAALSYRDAVHGGADAQADLGARYAEGRGLPQSDERAVHWLTRAAEQGHAGAALRLSEFHAVGRGTAKNDVTAYKWAFLAAVHGGTGATRDSALQMLDTLVGRMTEQQLVEARRLVDEPEPEPAATGSAVAGSTEGRQQPVSAHRASKLHHARLRPWLNRPMRHDSRVIGHHVPARFRFAWPRY